MMKTITDKARKMARRLNPLYLLTLLPFFSACYEYDESDRVDNQQTVPLTFYLQTAGQQSSTRGYEGEVGNITNEGTIHSVKVWLFDQELSLLVAYTEAFANNGTDGINSNNDVKKVTLDIPNYIITQKRKVDLYVVANGESIGFTLGSTATVAQLEAAKVNNAFAPASAMRSVPTTGLPFSYVEKDWKILNEDESALTTSLPVVRLTRAVSKVRFAFARTTALPGVEIVGIQLNENQIASEQFVLPKWDQENFTAPYNGDKLPNITANTYYGTQLSYGQISETYTGPNALYTTDKIAEFDEPDSKTFANYTFTTNDNTKKAREYDDFITNSVTSVNENDYLTYLYESDKALSGYIYYRFNRLNSDGTVREYGNVLKKEFTMTAAGDFARNHEWIVYAYFMGNKLEVKPIVQKWYWDSEAVDHTEWQSLGSIDISIFGDNGRQSYKVYNPTPIPDQEYPRDINWNNAYVGIYHGVELDDDNEEGGINGQPLYSPMIHLKTCYEQDLTLYLTNSTDFGFITVTIDETTGHHTYSPNMKTNPTATLPSTVTIPKATTAAKTDTYFFVVPRKMKDSDPAPANRMTKLYLLDEDNMKQPINPSFMPGPNNIEIWYYYVETLDAFNGLTDYVLKINY